MLTKRKPLPEVLAFPLLPIALFAIMCAAAEEKLAPAAASLDVLEREVAKQQEIVHALRVETNALAGKVHSEDLKTLSNLQNQLAEAREEVAKLSAVIKYLTNQPKAELPQAITIQGLDFQLSELRQQQANAEVKLAERLQELGPEHPDVERLTRIVAQIGRQVDERVEDFMRGLDPRLAAAKARKEVAGKAWAEAKPLYDEHIRLNVRHYEAMQQLRKEEQTLQRLRLRLAEIRARQK